MPLDLTFSLSLCLLHDREDLLLSLKQFSQLRIIRMIMQTTEGQKITASNRLSILVPARTSDSSIQKAETKGSLFTEGSDRENCFK